MPAALRDPQRLLDQFREPRAPALERGAKALVLAGELADGVGTGHRLGDVAEQHEERVRVVAVLDDKPLRAIHVLGQQRRGEVATIGEVAVQRRLPHPCPSGDLVHRNLGAICEQLSRRREDRLSVPLRVFAPRLNRRCHESDCSTGDLCPQHLRPLSGTPANK